MKKIIKVIVCFSVMVGLLSTTPALAQIDKEALDTLMAYEIIQGDTDGALRLEDSITRAEFAKIVCKLKGMPIEEKADTAFSDVPFDYWASGYINTANGLGIINGYEDGTFKPDNSITYAEAIKMLVVALGYEPFAMHNGGYPQGYTKTAERYGLLGDVKCEYSDTATRGNVFALVYNALDIPIMEQTTYGADAEYTIWDGNDGVPLVTLRTLSGFETE